MSRDGHAVGSRGGAGARTGGAFCGFTCRWRDLCHVRVTLWRRLHPVPAGGLVYGESTARHPLGSRSWKGPPQLAGSPVVGAGARLSCGDGQLRRRCQVPPTRLHRFLLPSTTRAVVRTGVSARGNSGCFWGARQWCPPGFRGGWENGHGSLKFREGFRAGHVYVLGPQKTGILNLVWGRGSTAWSKEAAQSRVLVAVALGGDRESQQRVLRTTGPSGEPAGGARSWGQGCVTCRVLVMAEVGAPFCLAPGSWTGQS